MGSSISKSKGSSSSQPTTFSCSTTSSERTMVHEEDNKKSSSFFGSSKNRPSILPSNSFFSNIRNKKTKANKDKVQINNHTVNSLSKRKRPTRYNNKRKKVTIVVTKSIIGRPTNFKHVNSSTTQFNHMQFLQEDDDEAAKVAAQMSLLSSLIKPLPTISDNNNDDADKIPIIPARSSSYGNAIYIKDFPIPATTSMATPSLKKTRKKVIGMKNNNGSLPRSSLAARNKRAQHHHHVKSGTKKIC